MENKEKIDQTTEESTEHYKWQKVWLKNGYRKPIEYYLIKKVGDVAWLSETSLKKAFQKDRTFIAKDTQYCEDEIEALQHQVEICNQIRRNETDALYALNLAIKNRGTKSNG